MSQVLVSCCDMHKSAMKIFLGSLLCSHVMGVAITSQYDFVSIYLMILESFWIQLTVWEFTGIAVSDTSCTEGLLFIFSLILNLWAKTSI